MENITGKAFRMHPYKDIGSLIDCPLNNGKMVQPPVFIDMNRKFAIFCWQFCRFLFFNSENHLEKEKNMPYLNLSSVFVFLFLFFVALFLFFLSLVIPLHESRFFRAHLLAVHKLFAPFLVVSRVLVFFL